MRIGEILGSMRTGWATRTAATWGGAVLALAAWSVTPAWSQQTGSDVTGGGGVPSSGISVTESEVESNATPTTNELQNFDQGSSNRATSDIQDDSRNFDDNVNRENQSAQPFDSEPTSGDTTNRRLSDRNDAASRRGVRTDRDTSFRTQDDPRDRFTDQQTDRNRDRNLDRNRDRNRDSNQISRDQGQARSRESSTVNRNSGERWRYRRHNNEWWYWHPDDYWVYWRDGRWERYSRDSYRPLARYRNVPSESRVYSNRSYDSRYDNDGYVRERVIGQPYYENRYYDNRYEYSGRPYTTGYRGPVIYDDGYRNGYYGDRYYNDGYYGAPNYGGNYYGGGYVPYSRGGQIGSGIGGAIGGAEGAAIGGAIGSAIGR